MGLNGLKIKDREAVAMDWMFITLQTSYVETLIPLVVLSKDGSFGGDQVTRVQSMTLVFL